MFFIKSRSVLRMGTAVEKMKAHFKFSNFSFFPKNIPFIRMWKNIYCISTLDTDDNMVRAPLGEYLSLRHSEYAILTVFLLEQCLHKLVSVLCCT
jgi:hypothetical protein